MKTGRNLEQLVDELARQETVKRDLCVPATKLACETRHGQCTLRVDENAGPARYPLSDYASNQLAKKLDIPFIYFKRLRDLAPDLLDLNVNGWLERNREDHYLIRTLDGRARAVLSNRYRRLDNFQLALGILPVLRDLPGARFESVELTAKRMYLKVVSSTIACEVRPGDVLQAGVIVSNSEIGCGRLRIEPLIYRLVCSNGLVVCERSMKKNHAGRALMADEELVVEYQHDTLEAEDHALFLKARDTVRSAVSEVTLRLVAQQLQKTTGIALAGDPAKTVEVLGSRYALTQDECAGVLRNLFEEGQLSGYGLINAVTGYARNIEDYDRATEFEELGGKLLNLNDGEWQRLAHAA